MSHRVAAAKNQEWTSSTACTPMTDRGRPGENNGAGRRRGESLEMTSAASHKSPRGWVSLKLSPSGLACRDLSHAPSS